MNVKQLITELQKYPEDMDVFMSERKTEFTYGLLNSVRSYEIDFMDAPDGKALANERVVVLDEE